MTGFPGRRCVTELSPSAKLVFTVLKYDGSLTQSELVTASGLSRDTVRRAAADLDDCGVLRRGYHPGDARRRRYELTVSA